MIIDNTITILDIVNLVLIIICIWIMKFRNFEVDKMEMVELQERNIRLLEKIWDVCIKNESRFDNLINVLVDKNILTGKEAEQIYSSGAK